MWVCEIIVRATTIRRQFLIACLVLFCAPVFASDLETYRAIKSHTILPNQCDEIEVGKHVDVSLPWRESPLKINTRFRVTRKQKDLYEIGVNPWFFKVENDQVIAVPVEKALRFDLQGCYDTVEPILLDDAGIRYRFKVDQMAPRKAVQIVPHDKDNANDSFAASSFANSEKNRYHRQNAGQFSRAITCSTFVHETFHWLGLVDEYEDKDHQGRHFNVGTWMANQRHLVAKHFGSYWIPKCLFDDPKTGSCLRADSSGYTVPKIDGRLQLGMVFDGYAKFGFNGSSPGEKWVAWRDHAGEGVKPPPTTIFAGYKNKIIHPGCKKRNHLYNECSRFAYRSLEPVIGLPMFSSMVCGSHSHIYGGKMPPDPRK